MTVFKLNENQLKEAMKLSEYAFQFQLAEDQIEERIETMKQHHQVYGINENDQLAAKLHLLPLSIYLGNNQLKMGGIAGVATYPEYRRKGFVKELLKEALFQIKDQGMSVSLLHPFSVPFYRKFGWELFSNRMKYVLNKSDLIMKNHPNGTVKRLTKEDHSAEIERVYEQYAEQFNGMLVRERSWWQNSAYGNQFIAVYYDDNGNASGYFMYSVHNRKMNVTEFIALTSNARISLWNFICQHDSMIEQVEMTIFERDPLHFMLKEPRIKAELTPYFMARIVDLDAFLAQYDFQWNHIDQGLILHIEDDLLLDNQKSVQLHAGQILNAHDTDAGIHLSINTLTAVLFGYQRPRELVLAGLISGSEACIEQLEALIPNRSPFFSDFF
ncbi:GNAT family N-acetyltransferase [Peribacillus loiseleuriae]|uniref:GNAT family N-acetyltransferase n=1 Tax=Peribacillus loiseleuriae TaxID=1679170 RepID=UPI003CFD6FB3